MNDKWSYIDFKSLMNETLEGNRCIQEPITVYNHSGEKTKNVPFTTHLLLYENIHDDNLLEILHKIYMMFNTRVKQLNENDNIKEMIKQINGEWFKGNEILELNDPLPEYFFNTCKKDKRIYEKSNKKFNEMIELSNYEKDIPIDSKLREDYPMERELEGAIILCNKSTESITKSSLLLKEIIQKIKNYDISIFIELSTKHKPLYYKENSIHEDQSIPSNIHKIFSNYLHISNLFLKQLIIYYNQLITKINDIEKKCSELQILKKNVKIIAHLDIQENDIFDILINGIKNIFSSEKEEDEDNNEEGQVEILIEGDEGEDTEDIIDKEDDLLTYNINKLENINNGKVVSNTLTEFF